MFFSCDSPSLGHDPYIALSFPCVIPIYPPKVPMYPYGNPIYPCFHAGSEAADMAKAAEKMQNASFQSRSLGLVWVEELLHVHPAWSFLGAFLPGLSACLQKKFVGDREVAKRLFWGVNYIAAKSKQRRSKA